MYLLPSLDPTDTAVPSGDVIPNGSSSGPPATTADAECGLPSEGGETESDSGGAVGGESQGSDLHATEDTTEVRIGGGGWMEGWMNNYHMAANFRGA